MTERVAFGLELQRARERRGLSLDELAECTKISGTLFAGLERGDLSRWPSGIFRRAFVRSYAQAVGLDSEDTVRRFLRLYHDGDDGAEAASPALVSAAPAGEGASEAGPRLVLAQPETVAPARLARLLRRSAAALVDVALALAAALLVSAWFGGAWFWMAAALAAALGHVLTCSFIGTTPGGWLLKLHGGAASVKPRTESPAQVKPRVEADAPVVQTSRRRQPRHASGPRPVAAARPRRVQY